MLTTEIIAAQDVLKDLTPEQISAITTLSANDEQSVIATKTGEIYGGIDKDLLEVTGIAKNGTEKTYDYVKRVAGQLKSDAGCVESLNTTIQTLTTEKSRLEEAIKKGGDQATKDELFRKEAELQSTKNEYNKLKERFDSQESDFNSKMIKFRVSSEFESAKSGFKFKEGLTSELTTDIVNSSIGRIMSSYKQEFTKDANGNETLAFFDSSGARVNDLANLNNPATAAYLLGKELEKYGILADPVRTQSGAGTKGSEGGSGQGGSQSIDVSGCKNQLDAVKKIESGLAAIGLVRGSDEYDKARTQAYEAGNVDKLPIN